jgi:hypothetical protein
MDTGEARSLSKMFENMSDRDTREAVLGGVKA